VEDRLPASEKRFPVSPGVTPGVVMGVMVVDSNVSRFDVSDGVAVSSPAAGASVSDRSTTGSCASFAGLNGSSSGAEALGAFAVICLARYLKGSSVMSSE